MIKRKMMCTLEALLIVLTTIIISANIPSAMAAHHDDDVLVYGGASAQNEVSIAVNPLNSSNIVVGFNDWIPATNRWVASYAYSIDGGPTWTYGGQLPDVGGILAGEPFADPWLAFDSEGFLYYAAMSSNASHEIFVSVASPDADGMVGPLGFGDPQVVDAGAKPNDKPAIAVDRTGGIHDGNIYVVWARSPGNVNPDGFRIWFRRGTRIFRLLAFSEEH